MGEKNPTVGPEEEIPYDLEAVYDEQVFPLMQQVIEICKAHGLPMFFSVQYARRPDDPKGDGIDRKFCTTLINNIPGRPSAIFQRCLDIVKNGLPENRPMAFMITHKTGGK